MDYTQLSKTVAHALRHEPWLYEIELDGKARIIVESSLATLRQNLEGVVPLLYR